MSNLLSFIFSNIANMNLAVYGNGLAVVMTSQIMLECDVYQQKMHSLSKNICGISFFVLKISVVYKKDIIIGDIPWIFAWLKDKFHGSLMYEGHFLSS